MLVRMLMVAGPRSHQVNRSRLEINVAHTIATFRATDEVRSGKLWCIAEKLPTTEAILPRIDQRKISIDLFRLARRKFGSAIRISFQLSDNKKSLKQGGTPVETHRSCWFLSTLILRSTEPGRI